MNPVSRRAGIGVVNINDGRAILLDIGGKPFLDCGVALHRAVTIEMIFRDIQQDADGRFQRRRKIDLIGRNLQNVGAARLERRERQNGHADIAAHLRVNAGALQ